jgi:tetratricopeptide (TPR) repeat protein
MNPLLVSKKNLSAPASSSAGSIGFGSQDPAADTRRELAGFSWLDGIFSTEEMEVGERSGLGGSESAEPTFRSLRGEETLIRGGAPESGVPLRSLEEALERFEDGPAPWLGVGGAAGRAAGLGVGSDAVEGLDGAAYGSAPEDEPVRLADGKLNINYLITNAGILLEAGDHELARNIYRAVLATGEASGEAHLGLGKSYEAEGNIELAERHYGDSVAYRASIEACQRLAALLIRRRQDQQAAKLLERAIALGPESEEAAFELHKAAGNCWLRAERFQEAERHYRGALERRPGSAAVLTNLGSLQLQMGRVDEAARSFHAALAVSCDNDRALAGLGACALARGDRRAAHDFYTKSLDLNLDNPSGIFNLVKCAYELKTHATAARILGAYVQRAPVNTNLLYSLAGLQFHLGRLDEARETVRRVLALRPDHSGALELEAMLGGAG